jgi:hypothetical protein
MTTATTDRAAICQELQALQRERSVVLKSRNMQATRLQAVVAGTLGYHSGMPEKDREKKFTEAAAAIRAVADGATNHPLRSVIQVTLVGIDAFNEMKANLEREMVKLAKQLPAAPWVEHPDQRGFGYLFLAIVIGETGDLSNYANPAKVWRRLGCAPWSFGDRTQMGATWRSGAGGKLPASEWEAFGYSPRRRSIAFLIGQNMKMQNQGGPYRARFDETKAKIQAAHPDYSKLRCDRHGMLLATKLLLKNLWIKWNDAGAV